MKPTWSCSGDISNGLAHLDVLDASGLTGVVFHEIIKFRAPDPEATVAHAERRIAEAAGGTRWPLALAAHAPYSVSPSVFEAWRDVAWVNDGAPETRAACCEEAAPDTKAS